MGGKLYAHVRVGACDIAVAAADIVLAVDLATAAVTPLPRREGQHGGALAGLVEHKGSVVPVVDLGRWVPLGTPPHEQPDARLLMLRAGKALVAVQVDALLGVKRVDASAIRTVCHDNSAEELFEAVVPATTERPLLCVLEVGRLMSLAAVWCEAAALEPGAVGAATATTAAGSRKPAGSVRHAVFTVGDTAWAVPASAVAEVTRTPNAELRLAGRRVCGIGTWATRKLPLVDLAFSHDGAGTSRAWMAVISNGRHVIGLVVDSCDRLIDLAPDEICLSPQDELRAGTMLLPGELGGVSVMDVTRFFLAFPEATISELRPGAAGQGAEPAGLSAGAASDVDAVAPGKPQPGASEATDYLVFDADRSYASPIRGVMGVMPLAADAIENLSHGRPAAVEWRGETLGVVNMPQIDGSKALFEPRLAVVVKSAGDETRHSAIAVRSLTRWLPARSAHRSVMRMHALGDVEVVTPSGSRRSESLVVVDLAQMAYLLG